MDVLNLTRMIDALNVLLDGTLRMTFVKKFRIVAELTRDFLVLVVIKDLS